MYSAAISHSSIVAFMPTLEHHRHAGAAGGLQQREVLHVAGADLQHVGVLADQADVLGLDHLRDDRQAGLGSRLGEDLRPRFPRPWKAYGEVRGLNAPPRSNDAPAAFAIFAAAIVCSGVSTAHGPRSG